LVESFVSWNAMKLFNEYRTQGIFVCLMSTLILGGILVLTGLYKGVAVDFPRHMLPWYFRFILSYGIFLMLIPVFWTSATIRLENHPVLRYHRVWTFVTGMLLLIGLTCLFVHCGSQLLIPSTI
jgi:hypothetical protein